VVEPVLSITNTMTPSPFSMLLIYAKAKQDNLTDAQKAQLKKLVDAIIAGVA
jgi:hypothetical protein